VDTKVSEEETVKKAKLISAMRDYKRKRTRSEERRVDFTVSPSEEDEKILIRAITEPKSKSGYIGVDTVREMIDFWKKRIMTRASLLEKNSLTRRKER